MNQLDGTWDGGGDGTDEDYECDHHRQDDYDGEGEDDYERVVHDEDEFPQSEYGDHHDDAGDFESHQLALDNDYD